MVDHGTSRSVMVSGHNYYHGLHPAVQTENRLVSTVKENLSFFPMIAMYKEFS